MHKLRGNSNSEEDEVVVAIIKYVNSQKNGWKFIHGRAVLEKQDFLFKVKKDKEFQKNMVKLVNNLSVDLLLRGKT